MAKTLSVGQLLINDALPEDMRDETRVLDAKGLKKLFSELAKQHPEKYREVSFKLNQLGQRVSYYSGGASVGLQHFMKSRAAAKRLNGLKKEIAVILDDDSLTDKQRDEKLIKATAKHSEPMREEIFQEAVSDENPLAEHVTSGFRGNKMNLASLLGADLLYQDHHGNVIPVPVLKSYSEGLSPMEYWASTYGARQGVMATKFATRDAGDLGKQAFQIAHRLIVSQQDADKPSKYLRGLPVDVTDMDSEGSLLATKTGPYPANTILTPKILHDLESRGIKKIVVRSPAVTGAPDGGIYAKDAGVREFNRLPTVGEAVGGTAVQALSEPFSQAQLCLARGTLVRMADWSIKRIEDIRRGDWVLGADFAGNTFPVKVVRVFDNGVRDCVTTHFREPFRRKHGRKAVLTSTLDHKALLYRRVSNTTKEYLNNVPQLLPIGIATGRITAVLPDEFLDTKYYRNEPFAPIIGLLLGDGCYTEAVGKINLSCYDPQLVADPELQRRLARLNLKLTKLKGHEGYYSLSIVDDDLTDFRDDKTGRVKTGSRNPVRKWLESRGMYGKYAHEKQLPVDVYSWSNRSIAELIGGYFSADGSIFTCEAEASGKPYISFGSTSRQLVVGVKELLEWRFGIYVSGPYSQPAGEGGNHAKYSINICTENNITKFCAKIPAYGVKKQRMSSLLKTWVVERPRDFNRLIRDRIEIAGPRETFDIEVDHPDHLFVLANGLIVSNSQKHSGGVAGSAQSVSGFDAINQLIQVPKTFKGGATHSTTDGTVQKIEESPTGGVFVTVNDVKHYVPASLTPTVKKGDEIEAGDVLSDGIPDPSTVTEYKGIGDGRRYFIQAFIKAMRGAGLSANRRNVELLARGLINHVRVTDEMDGYVPDDVVPYSRLEHDYRPRKNAVQIPVRAAKGRYMEVPSLHYSIGTRVTPNVMRQLEEYGIPDVVVHDDPPPFRAEMIRGRSNLANDPDWMVQMFGSGLKKSLLDATARGAESNELGTSFVPSRARAVDFGRIGVLSGRPQKR